MPPIRLSAEAIRNALREDQDLDIPDSFGVLIASDNSTGPLTLDAVLQGGRPDDSDVPEASDDGERSDEGVYWADRAEAQASAAGTEEPEGWDDGWDTDDPDIADF